MAHLEKLSIQGVRSFDPDTRQEINFLPLTIILGPNGAGKTTIIESLKYATTGNLPPNCNAGKSFVHDVQFAKKAIVRGQIRLRFTDVEKKSTVITRSMQTSLKQPRNASPQITFKQLNSVIKRDGKSIDQKCADINSQVMELIGVSKAMLNSVIFCHQEEINWPLSDGKVLKEKFDDIFGSIGYVKMLERIKKTREEEIKKFRLLEKDVHYFALLKKEADSKRKNLNEEKARLDTEKAKVKEIEVKSKELTEKLSDLIDKEANAEEVNNAISQIEGSIAEKRNLARGIEKTCSVSILCKSKDQVDEELEHFDENSKQMVVRKKELEAKFVTLESDYARLENDKHRISVDVAKISECTNQIYKLTAERNTLISQIESNSSEFYSIFSKINVSVHLSSSDRAIVRAQLDDQIDQLKNSANEQRASEQIQEFKLKQDLDSLKSMKSNSFHEKLIWQKQLVKVEKDFAQIERTMGRSGFSEAQLASLDEKIAQYRAQLAQCGSGKEEEQKASISRLENKKRELKEHIERMERQIEIAMVNNKDKVEYDFHSSQRDEKVSKIEKIKMKHFEVYCQVGAYEGDFSDKLNEYINQVSGEYEQLIAKVTSYEKELCMQKSKLESRHELLSKRIKELDTHKSKFDGLSGIHNFETFLKEKELQLQQLRDAKLKLSNLVSVIDCQIDTISMHDMCPVCENDLSSNWTSKQSARSLNKQCLLKTLEKNKEDNPEELKRIDAQIAEAEQLHIKLVQLRSNFDAIHGITKEIPLIKADMSSIKEQIGALQKSIEEERIHLNCCKEKVDSLRKCTRDANDYDSSLKELKDIDRKLQQFDPTRWTEGLDLEDLNCELKMLQLTLKSTEKNLFDLQNEFTRASKERIDLQTNLQNAERNKSEFEKQEHNKIANFSKRNEIASEVEELKQKICNLEGKSSEFDPQIDRIEVQLRALTAESKQFEKDNQQAIFECQEMVKKLERIFKEIDQYTSELKQAQLKTSKEYIDKLGNNIEQLEEDRRTLTLQITEASQGIANLELQKRELLDCQRYLVLRQSIGEQEEKLKEQRRKMGNMDFATIKTTRVNVENELTVMKTKSTIGIERIREIDDRIGKLATELKSDGYENADSKYKRKLIEKTVTEMACDDLNKYYKALDFSISSFHKCKMEEINKLLQKFWEIAYQGKDIDYIMIVSDEEERSASDKRRNYNYRVVMVKKGKEMDMKGRCSAGQKVLASLIIRLALAVIFCRNFAVLTLDEPTTNLDKANIHSFARAVISLIKSNRNFQIIIITHDDEFLDCLDADTGEFYYKVFKNDKGYSSIIRKSINEYDTQTTAGTSKRVGKKGEARKGVNDDDEEYGDIHLEPAPKRARVHQNGTNNTTNSQD